jgi:hypothetical protein
VNPRKLAAGVYKYRGHTLRRERRLCNVGPSGRVYSMPRSSARWHITPSLGEHGPPLWSYGYQRLSEAMRAVDFAAQDSMWVATLELAAELGRKDRASRLEQLDGVSAEMLAKACEQASWSVLPVQKQAELLTAWKGEHPDVKKAVSF